MIKTIIFDLGSVCFEIDWEAINKEMIKKFGISTMIRSNYGKDINKIYDKAQRGEVSLKDVFEIICKEKKLDKNEVTDYYKNLYKKNKKINEKLTNLINKLKGKVKIACLSDTNDIHFLAHEEQKHLDNFDFVFASFKIGKIKRDKGAFEKILEELGVKSNEVVLVDDNDKNIENAKLHGLRTIKYENYEQLIKDLKKFGVNV
ncbi:MAG: HAD-IA family hydrolase [Nanoarchaeota archaeon]|nr:HAD-IA family hydrolase [Nanoarchaeota archaeon]